MAGLRFSRLIRKCSAVSPIDFPCNSQTLLCSKSFSPCSTMISEFFAGSTGQEEAPRSEQTTPEKATNLTGNGDEDLFASLGRSSLEDDADTPGRPPRRRYTANTSYSFRNQDTKPPSTEKEDQCALNASPLSSTPLCPRPSRSQRLFLIKK